MQINKLIKVGERIEVKQILHPSEVYENPDTGLEEIRTEWVEEIEVVSPIMEAQNVDMTDEEEAEYNAMIADSPAEPEGLNEDDITEILADHEYRICLMELGVDVDDL